ncbi:MAG: DUF370 domain-containing protein [Clostridia bacterium]|nr:DUF370 domain-containing protein [Clostridia bacterium]
MYLHAGNNKIIREKDIIGIFDVDNSTVSSITRKYLSDAEKEERVVSAKDEIPKSFILYKENGKYMICFSQISTSALLGRAENKANQQRSFNLQE